MLTASSRASFSPGANRRNNLVTVDFSFIRVRLPNVQRLPRSYPPSKAPPPTVCFVGVLLACAAGAQDLSKPVLTAGISVKMAISRSAVAIAADGKVFKGTTAAEPETLVRGSAG